MRKRRLGKLRSPRWMRQGTSWLSHRVHNMTRAQRIICASIASVVLLSVTVPTALIIIKNQSYKLSAEIQQLIGTPNKNLSAKISYNSEKDSWQFNQSNIPIGSGTGNSGPQDAAMPSVADLKSQVGGGGKKDESLYAVDMPSVGSKGVTYYDTNTDLSFSLVPNFNVSEGRQSDGRIVYPAENGAKLIYTAKANGMKEDIVLDRPIGDEPTFAYKLNLPNTLEAKIQSDGSLGVFSPDPILFGDISFGGDSDKEKILSARQTATKDHLLFVLPAPVVVEADGHKSTSHARFILAGDTLTVQTNGMQDLKYPLSVDPSVVVTSSGDFGLASGDLIDYATDQISRGNMTGGTLGSWSTTSSYSSAGTTGVGVAAQNGYLYAAGGDSGGTVDSDVEYVAINGDGTVGTWTTTSSLGTARASHGFTTTDTGYAYAVGGCVSGGSATTSVEYAQINSNGTLGSWSATSSLSSAACGGVAVAYGGYLYYLGGSNSTTVQYALLNANGTLGSWNTTTSFTNSRQNGGAFAYNNRMYILGGYNGTSTYYADVQFANINSDGTLGTWTSTTSFTTARAGQFYGVYGGYAYIGGGSANIGGSNDAVGDTQYAQINADGTLGAWRASSDLSSERFSGGSAMYKGYIYALGGSEAGSGTRSVQYSTVTAGGSSGAYGSSTTFTTKRGRAGVVVYNNYIYVTGGDSADTGGGTRNTTRVAPLNDDGSVGSYVSGRALPTALTALSVVAYRGYMYVLGGCTATYTSCDNTANNVATVYRSAIAADGTLGVWNTDTSFTTARHGLSAVAYGGYLYIMGGVNGTTFQNDIQYHAIGASGAISGAWSTSSYTISTARGYMGTAVDGGKLYIAGGCSAGALTCTTTQNDIQYGTFGSSGDLTGSLTTNSTSFSTTRGYLGLVIDGGYAYVIGGWAGGTNYYDDTQYAPMNSNGSVGSWTTGAYALPVARGGAGVVTANGYAYVIGGFFDYFSTQGAENSTYYAPLLSGGSGKVSSSWTSVTGPGSSRTDYSVAMSGGYLYVVGGTISGSATATVYYAPVNADGSIGSWSSTSGLVAARSDAAVYAIGGYMYVAGGNNGSSMTSAEYAAINSNGTLGSWATATATLSAARDSGAYAAYNNRAYYIGGNNSTPQTTVYYADLSTGGNFSSWSTTTALATGTKDASAVAYNGYMYVIGGTTASGDIGEVYYAVINSNGTLGSWAAASWVPSSGIMAATAANGMLYVLGTGADRDKTYRASIHADGSLSPFEIMRNMSNASTITIPKALYINGKVYAFRSGGDAQYSGVDSISRIGKYAKTVELGGDYELDSITYGGAITDDAANFKYQAAPSSGTFGSIESPSGITGGGGGGSGCGGGGGDTRYVRLLATLDDTLTSVHPDVNSSESTITDMTVTYTSSATRAAPNQRLMHGKYFTSETLQPLDTCGG